MGVGLQFLVQGEHQALKARVVAPCADAPGQGEEVRLGALIRGLERVFKRGGFQLGGALLVAQGKAGVKPQRGGVLAQQRDAEAVDGADLRAAEQGALAAQIRGLPARGALGQLGDVLAYLAAQLLRGGAGEGDDQEAVHVGTVFAEYVAHQAFYQHAGLAASGGGGDKQLAAAVGYGQSLAGRRGEFSHRSQLLPAAPTRARP